jgi:anti-sigma B factor antagonist
MLKVEAEKLGTVTILHFEGRIVSGISTTILRESVLNQAGANALILDFAHVDLIDAGGLGALLELREWTQLTGIEFKLLNVISRVRQVFEITRLDSLFDINSEDMVLSAATGSSSVVESIVNAHSYQV